VQVFNTLFQINQPVTAPPFSHPTMPIRNPFAKRPDVQTGLQPYEEGIRPLSQNGAKPTFEKVDTIGSKGSSAMSISSRKSQEPVEYKMSGIAPSSNFTTRMGSEMNWLISCLKTVVNDSGVYLPVSFVALSF
jgi:hypothetical protein